MKKIIALALALIMALSMASVAFATYAGADAEKTYKFEDATFVGHANNVFTYNTAALDVAPGTTVRIDFDRVDDELKGYKIATDFTEGTNTGASLVESVKIIKAKHSIELTLKESYTLDTEKDLKGDITLTKKNDETFVINVDWDVCNNVEEVAGEKKAKDAENADITGVMKNDTIILMDEDGGYVSFAEGVLAGTVKMAAEEEAFVYFTSVDEDTQDAIDAYLGEDYDAIVEYYNFGGKGFKSDVAFTYDAEEEDPHYFYAWDGEKFVAIDATFNADEDVEKYEFTAAAEGVIIVTDVEIVAAAEEETKNPDTGANDVVGVAAALAVVSLVAAGAVSLKK